MFNKNRIGNRPSDRGFTLIELMVTLAVAGVLVGIAAPSMRAVIERRHLDGAVSQMVGHLLMARSQAIAKNRPSFVDFVTAEDAWSYGLDDSASCDPQISDDCQINGSERVYRSGEWKNVRMAHTFMDAEVSFEPRRGMVSDPAAVILSSPAGVVEVSLSPIGYVSVCAVGTPFGRYEVCES